MEVCTCFFCMDFSGSALTDEEIREMEAEINSHKRVPDWDGFQKEKDALFIRLYNNPAFSYIYDEIQKKSFLTEQEMTFLDEFDKRREQKFQDGIRMLEKIYLQ